MTIGAAAAGTWRMGDLTVNRIGFGAMRLTGGVAFDRASTSDRERSVAVLRRAVELGVNHIDTAAFYFSPRRSANELIDTALAPYPDDLVIATKVGPGRDASGEWLPWARPDQLRGQVEENLRQLGRDHLDVVNLRLVSSTRPFADHFAALARLQGIAFVPFFAIAGEGRESGANGTDGDAVRAVALAHDVTPAQVRLAWTLHRGPHVLAIPGTGDPDHLVPNVAAGALRLTPDDLAALDKEQQT